MPMEARAQRHRSRLILSSFNFFSSSFARFFSRNSRKKPLINYFFILGVIFSLLIFSACGGCRAGRVSLGDRSTKLAPFAVHHHLDFLLILPFPLHL